MNSLGFNKQSLRPKQYTLKPDPTEFGQLNLANIGWERWYTPSHSFLGAELRFILIVIGGKQQRHLLHERIG